VLIAAIPPAALAVLAIVVRAVALGDGQLFRDEATSWFLASHSIGDLLALSSHETFPPLYVLMLKGWMTLFGSSEAGLRSLSIAAGVGTVLVTWRWARDALGRGAALIAAALVVLSPALVVSSREARMYSLEGLFATGAWWLLWLLVARGTDWFGARRWVAAIGLVACVAGEVWTMSLGIPTAGLQFAFALVALLWIRSRASAAAMGCIAVGGLSLAPWLPNLLSVALNGKAFWSPRPGPEALVVTLGVWIFGDPRSIWVAAVVLAGAIALIWLLSANRVSKAGQAIEREALPAPGGQAPRAPDRLRSDRALALAIALGVGLVPVVWIYSQIHSIYVARYFEAAFPPLAIAIGAGVMAVTRRLRLRFPTFRRLPPSWLAILLILPVVSAMAAGSVYAIDDSRQDKGLEPARQMAQKLATLVHPGDAIVTLNAQTYFPLDYYLVEAGVTQRLGVGLYDWQRPTTAFFTGWMDIDDAHRVDVATVATSGWAGTVHLARGGVLWCVSLVNPDHEFAYFSPLASGQLREIAQIDIGGNGVTGQIREASPSDP
jgi:4-amino-4-deoxy-L-arabinose transferase-like glycosyltransferase